MNLNLLWHLVEINGGTHHPYYNRNIFVIIKVYPETMCLNLKLPRVFG